MADRDSEVRLEFVGPQIGEALYIGQVTQRHYRAGNNDLFRFINVDPKDVKFLTSIQYGGKPIFKVVDENDSRVEIQGLEQPLPPREPLNWETNPPKTTEEVAELDAQRNQPAPSLDAPLSEADKQAAEDTATANALKEQADKDSADKSSKSDKSSK